MLKNKFNLPKNTVYLCGHSLGPMPKSAHRRVNHTLKHWGQSAVKSWNDHKWIDLPKTIGTKIAPLIGAKPNEVIVSDSTSVNLYKALKCALKINHSRKIILTTQDNFPADLYITEGIAKFDSSIVAKTIPPLLLEKNMGKDIALIILSHVNYRDASVFDIKRITELAHQHGILVIWDLSHSVGIMPINLSEIQADFAVGCTYKYLNGGPGSPAFIYVNAKHHEIAKNPIFGWMGHKEPFKFCLEYKTSNNINKFMGGTPSILSMVALDGALDIYENLDLNKLFVLRESYSDYIISALESLNLNVITPKQNNLKGGHVAFTHPYGYALSRTLLKNNIILDYREPNLIRMCINPLYLKLSDLNYSLTKLKHILNQKLYLNPEYSLMQKVT